MEGMSVRGLWERMSGGKSCLLNEEETLIIYHALLCFRPMNVAKGFVPLLSTSQN